MQNYSHNSTWLLWIFREKFQILRLFPKRARRSPEIVLNIPREMRQGGEVETVGNIGEREATVFEQMREFHGGIAVDPVVGRLTTHALADFREVLGRDAELASVPRHVAVLEVVAAFQHGHKAIHHRRGLSRNVRLAVDARVEFEEVDKKRLKHGNHLVAVKILVRMPHATEHLLKVALAQPLFLLVEVHDGVDVERHAAAGAVVGMRGADVDEVEVHIDDAHTEIRRRFQARHLPVGHHNHAVALAEMQLTAPVPYLALALRAVGMGDVVHHPCLRNAVEVVVDDDISLVEFHGAKL